MKTLQEIFLQHATWGKDVGHGDKGSTHSYIETYEKLFEPFRNGCSFMEIGLAMGWSMKMWDEYFSNSKITGVDIGLIFDTTQYSEQCRFIECDATKPELIGKLGDQKFDIIVEDGSHMESDQIATFELLKHRMNPNGIYIIEDILALDQNKHRFKALHHNCEIIDLRGVKNRFDDVLIIYTGF